MTRVYGVLQINSNEYGITKKIILRSNNTIYSACLLPIDIFNNEIVKIV